MSVGTPTQTLRQLQVIVWLQWTGATLGLPLLPLFLEGHDARPGTIGVIIASFFVAGMLTQFLAGHFADRFGRRAVLIGGLIAFGLASPTYLLNVNAHWFILTRIIQGAAAGAIEVASLSTVAGLFAEEERGKAMSKIYSAQLFGIAVGPLLGVWLAVSQIGWAYTGAGLASLLAALVAKSRLPRLSIASRHEDLPPLRITRQVIGAVVGAAGLGFAIGVYESSWSLMMNSLGASVAQIRLSWTVFCIPWVVLSSVGGRVADRFDRRFVAGAGLVNAAFFLWLYPHIHNPWVLVAIGSFESIGAALTAPSMSSLLTQGAHDRELGRRQGMSTTANTAALALSAAISGPLFNVSPSTPFTVFALMTALCASTLVFWWRQVEGRVSAPRN